MDTREIIQEAQGLLQKINFPAHKQDIVDQAKQQNASGEVTDALQKLPDQQFGSMQDVLKKLPIGSLGGIPGM